MSELKRGQLVAVRDRNDKMWQLRVVESRPCTGNDDPLIACWAVEAGSPFVRPWAQAKPAEEVWPELFLDKEQRVADQSIHAVEMEQELVQRLRRQIRWLCREINEVAFEFGRDYVCPPSQTIDKGCQSNCVACWEEASLKAVAEEEDDG